MSEKSTRLERSANAPPANSVNGHALHNKILLALPTSESAALFPKLEFLALPVRTVLAEARAPIKFPIFVNDGLASFLSLLSHEKSVEVGLCGREGFVGLPLVAGFRTNATRVIAQVAGSGFRLSAKDLLSALPQCPNLVLGLLRFDQEMALQSAQVAACNQLHSVDKRLARWLLMSQDRLTGDIVPLTQEFLGHMLGIRRASVSEAEGVLQKAGLIAYKRGLLRIVNRAELEKAACSCYETMTHQLKTWHSEVI